MEKYERKLLIKLLSVVLGSITEIFTLTEDEKVRRQATFARSHVEGIIRALETGV